MDTTSFSETADQMGDRLRAKVEGAERQVGRFSGWMNTFIDKHQAACVLGALALGYVVARFARRGH